MKIGTGTRDTSDTLFGSIGLNSCGKRGTVDPSIHEHLVTYNEKNHMDMPSIPPSAATYHEQYWSAA
ncbi:hypothetical protein WG66_006835 [Moniliophthora roreri]|nr:hypothetical protein WG66_006835 [Moniliophthora roreri]